jgi:hypothetical protein
MPALPASAAAIEHCRTRRDLDAGLPPRLSRQTREESALSHRRGGRIVIICDRPRSADELAIRSQAPEVARFLKPDCHIENPGCGRRQHCHDDDPGGAVVAAINMIGTYTSANFSARSGGSGVEIFDPTVPNGGIAAPGSGQSLPPHSLALPDISFGALSTLAFSQYPAGTPITTDCRNAASIMLLGYYMAGSLVGAFGGHGGTLNTDEQLGQQSLLAHPPHR